MWQAGPLPQLWSRDSDLLRRLRIQWRASVGVRFEGRTMSNEIQTIAESVLAPLDAGVMAFIEASKAANTRKAYASDWQHFEAWCYAGGAVSPRFPRHTGSLRDGARRDAQAEHVAAAPRVDQRGASGRRLC